MKTKFTKLLEMEKVVQASITEIICRLTDDSVGPISKYCECKKVGSKCDACKALDAARYAAKFIIELK